MMPSSRRTLTLLILCTTVLVVARAADSGATGAAGHWPAYRGEGAAGVADGAGLPMAWDVESGKNVRWKTVIPGLGHSSPVIWGDRLFVTTAVSSAGTSSLKVGLYGDIAPVEDEGVQRWLVLCLSTRDGSILWQRQAHEGVPAVKRHTKASHANSTPATDGRHVVAFFGSEGLHVFDMDGNLKWKKDLGALDSGFYMVPTAQWGFGSSPIIHDGKVIVQCDVQKGSFLAAFSLEDGRELWRTSRDEVPTWSTPTVVTHGGVAEVVVNGYKHIGGYDLATGKELWRLVGGGDIPVPTPIVWEDLVFITSAHGPQSPVYAIKKGVRGEIKASATPDPEGAMAWNIMKGGAYMQTPLVYGGNLYVCRDNGVLSAFDARTGKRLYQERLGSGSTGFTASAVAADGRLYYTSEMGDVHVVAAGPEFKLVASNSLGDMAMATPAIAGRSLYFRTRGHVVAVGETTAD